MRPEIVYFLEHEKSERVMYFMLGSMNLEDLLTLFDYLKFTSEQAGDRWETAYAKLLDTHFH